MGANPDGLDVEQRKAHDRDAVEMKTTESLFTAHSYGYVSWGSACPASSGITVLRHTAAADARERRTVSEQEPDDADGKLNPANK